MKLFYTPRSHFSRKVRLVAGALELNLELVDVGNVASDQPFGGNPLMKVPTLLLDDRSFLIDSDHIAQTLVRLHDADDGLGVLGTSTDTLNLRAVLNGIMAAEVELILAERTGLGTHHPRFDKMRRAIERSLDWLESKAEAFPEGPSYVGFHLVCMWDHVALYEVVTQRPPRLGQIVGQLSELPYVAATRPS